MLAHELSAALTGWLERLMPAGERRDALLGAIAARFGADNREVGAGVRAELREEARRHSPHLDVEWVPAGGLVPDTESRGRPDPDPAEVTAQRAGIAAERIAGAGVLVLDLRANGGALDTRRAPPITSRRSCSESTSARTCRAATSSTPSPARTGSRPVRPDVPCGRPRPWGGRSGD